jgi:hypothetical protein
MKFLHPIALQKRCDCHSGDRRIDKCVVCTPRRHGTACHSMAAKRQLPVAESLVSPSMRGGPMLQ